MKFDYSWNALSKPGNSNHYFDFPTLRPLLAGAQNFDVNSALCLAEFSRLTYHKDFIVDNNIQYGRCKFEILDTIENKDTSTYGVLFKTDCVTTKGDEQSCLVIAFRGTYGIDNWKLNVRAYQQDFENLGVVHSGFAKAWRSIDSQLFNLLEGNCLPVFITGHSLGAALATLTAAKMKESLLFESCYTFGSPRIGNHSFIQAIQNMNIYRVINNCDIVSLLPLNFAAIQYEHIGTSELMDDDGTLIEGLNETDILLEQQNRLPELKNIYGTALFNNINTMKENVPRFLSDHAPVNYIAALERVVGKKTVT